MASESRVGTKIKRRRQALDWTQAELAEKVGVHESTVTAWESGKHFPGRHQGKVEAVLGISLDGAPSEEVYTDPVERLIWSLDRYSTEERHRMIERHRQEPGARKRRRATG